MNKEKWEVRKLGEVCDVEYGTRVVRKRDGGAIYPVYGGGGATFYMDTYNREDALVVSRFAMSEQCTRYVEGKFFLNDSGLTVKTKDETKMLQSFLNMQIFHLNDYIYSLSRGAAQRNLNVPSFRKMKIVYPKSLSEQQRIVSLLDEAFEAIDQAKANAKKNLENARELFESYLQSVFETKGKGWEEKKLEEIAELMYGFTEKSKLEGDYRYIRITDIDSEGLLCPNGKVYVDKSEAHKSYILKNNDLVMARTGASFGDVMLYEDIEPSIFASYLIRITFKEQIDNKLYWYFAKSPLYWNQARSLATGSAQPQFNGNAVKQVVFRYPKSINTQQEIIQQLDNLSDEIKQIEINYQSRIEMLDELRKSILEKAFNGEL